MGDINDINAAQSVKIIGSDNTGEEKTPARTSDAGDIGAADVIHQGGTNGDLSVGTTAVVAKVGGSNYANRKFVRIYNSGTTKLYWGFKSGTTASSGADAGEPIFKKSWVTIAATDDVDVYVVSDGASGTATIIEGG